MRQVTTMSRTALAIKDALGDVERRKKLATCFTNPLKTKNRGDT
jgi:hypothetical protein